MKKYYYIDGESQTFSRLTSVKHHIAIAYTPRERKQYLNGANIVGVLGVGLRSITPIYVNHSGEMCSYGRTRKECVSW